MTGTTKRGTKPDSTPLKNATDARNTRHFIASGQTALPMDSQGDWWTGANVFSSGNLKLDLLHNFFLECGARVNKMRVYEMVNDPKAREMVGYLLVRGGVHIVAYARALERLTGVEVTKLVPVPDLSNKAFPETKKHEDRGEHRRLYTFRELYWRKAGLIFTGNHPEDGQPLEVVYGNPEGVGIMNKEQGTRNIEHRISKVYLLQYSIFDIPCSLFIIQLISFCHSSNLLSSISFSLK